MIKRFFTEEQRAFIDSIQREGEISRVALVRRLIKTKSYYEKDIQSLISDAVIILCSMTDIEYKNYDFRGV